MVRVVAMHAPVRVPAQPLADFLGNAGIGERGNEGVPQAVEAQRAGLPALAVRPAQDATFTPAWSMMARKRPLSP